MGFSALGSCRRNNTAPRQMPLLGRKELIGDQWPCLVRASCIGSLHGAASMASIQMNAKAVFRLSSPSEWGLEESHIFWTLSTSQPPSTKSFSDYLFWMQTLFMSLSCSHSPGLSPSLPAGHTPFIRLHGSPVQQLLNYQVLEPLLRCRLSGHWRSYVGVMLHVVFPCAASPCLCVCVVLGCFAFFLVCPYWIFDRQHWANKLRENKRCGIMPCICPCAAWLFLPEGCWHFGQGYGTTTIHRVLHEAHLMTNNCTELLQDAQMSEFNFKVHCLLVHRKS